MKKLCLHDISFHTNFHQNQSINKFAKMILAEIWSIMTLDDFKVILNFMKNLC